MAGKGKNGVKRTVVDNSSQADQKALTIGQIIQGALQSFETMPEGLAFIMGTPVFKGLPTRQQTVTIKDFQEAWNNRETDAFNIQKRAISDLLKNQVSKIAPSLIEALPIDFEAKLNRNVYSTPVMFRSDGVPFRLNFSITAEKLNPESRAYKNLWKSMTAAQKADIRIKQIEARSQAVVSESMQLIES